MMIQERLEAYRRKKHTTQMTESVKSKIQNVFSWNQGISKQSNDVDVQENLIHEETDEGIDTDSEGSIEEYEKPISRIKYVLYLLYFLLWVICYIIAIKYQFGAIYFIISALLFICLNTRSKPKKKGELSAYSVFNPNCEPIHGTVDASQLQRELVYGLHF